MKKSEYIKIVKFSSFFIKKYWYAKYINFFNPLKFHPANLENYLSLKKKKYFFFLLKL